MASGETRTFTTVEITEHSTLKASYEHLNKVYRKNHRELEKEEAALHKTLEEADKAETVSDAVELLTKMISGVSTLKRKADNANGEESQLIQGCKRRIDHLSTLSFLETEAAEGKENKEKGTIPDTSLVTSPTHARRTVKAVSAQRFNRLLADHLFTYGYYDTAIRLARDPGMRDLCLTEVYEETRDVEAALRLGDTKPAHTWCQECYFKLKHLECHFQFELRIFEFYLLVKKGERREAVIHARKYLSGIKKSDEYRAMKLRKAMCLLVERSQKEVIERAKTYQLSEDWIVRQFRAINLSFYSFNVRTAFSMTLKAGMSVIKTHDCYKAETRKPNCTVCHHVVNQLADALPYGKHEHSLLMCHQSGLLMNDDNPPMALPNGYVYSRLGLSQLVDTDGNIRCPRTEEIFNISEAQRVYIV